VTTDRPSRVRMKDVAERAKVSTATVSFVLNERTDARIPVATRDRVLRVARELGYHPNHTARSLRTQVTRTIGLVSDRIVTDSYGGDLIRGSLMTALRHDHLLMVVETEDDPAIERRLLDDLLSRQVDAVIYATQNSEHIRLPEALADQRLVLLNCTATGSAPAVLPDERQGGEAAARALLDAGHREGIHLVGETPERLRPARERRAGVEAALRDAGTALAGAVECRWWPESAYEAVASLLDGDGEQPRALICLNDRVAFGAYQALEERGLRVPDDVSVVSFDDSELARWLRPQLTSVALPYYEMGRRAVEILLDPEATSGDDVVAMPLRERGSVGPPRPTG
jgi:LacI family transcriptional regulator